VVAFWIDEKLERGVEITVGFADRANVVRRIIAESGRPRHRGVCWRSTQGREREK
jgi:hypothetical protein